MFVCDICIDICWSGSFKPKKTKKRVSSVTLPCVVAMAHGKVTIWTGLEDCFAVCHNAGTRRSDHIWPCAWGGTRRRRGGSPCVGRQDTRQTLHFRRVSCGLAHGEDRPTPSTEPHVVCSLYFAVCLRKHTANKFAVCPRNGTRQTRSLPSAWLPSATVGEDFAVCL